MAYPTNPIVGDRVRWESRMGTRRGEVINIFDTVDEFGDTINFYYVEYRDDFGTNTTMISENDVERLDFKVIFRDYDKQAELALYERSMEA